MYRYFFAIIFMLLTFSPVSNANQCLSQNEIAIEGLLDHLPYSGKYNSLLSIEIFHEGLITKKVGDAHISATLENGKVAEITVSGEVGLVGIIDEKFKETLSIEDLKSGEPISIYFSYDSPALITIRPKEGFTEDGGNIALELSTTNGNKTIDLSLQKIGEKFVLFKVTPTYYQKVKQATVGVTGLSLEGLKIKTFKL
jgi:hypothetical protein